jgi:hypothetical protein
MMSRRRTVGALEKLLRDKLVGRSLVSIPIGAWRVGVAAQGQVAAQRNLPPRSTRERQSEARMSLIVEISVVWVEMMFFASFTASAFLPESTSVLAMTSALV